MMGCVSSYEGHFQVLMGSLGLGRIYSEFSLILIGPASKDPDGRPQSLQPGAPQAPEGVKVP